MQTEPEPEGRTGTRLERQEGDGRARHFLRGTAQRAHAQTVSPGSRQVPRTVSWTRIRSIHGLDWIGLDWIGSGFSGNFMDWIG